MGERIVLGPTHIEISDQDFSAGYQEGYLRFTTHYQGSLLTDAEVYGFLARTIYGTMTTDRHRAGTIVGWCAALHALGRPGPTVRYYSPGLAQEAQVHP